jgi:hypothetical protein
MKKIKGVYMNKLYQVTKIKTGFSENEKITKALQWPYDFVVIENEKMISRVYPVYYKIQDDLEKIGGNSLISVFRKRERNAPINFDDFFNLNHKSIVYTQSVSFDTVPQNFTVLDSLSSFCFSGKKSGFLKDSE